MNIMNIQEGQIPMTFFVIGSTGGKGQIAAGHKVHAAIKSFGHT